MLRYLHTVQQEFSDLVRMANKTMDVARSRDPLPGLREVVAGLSNDQAHAHFRRTRPVVYTLRDTTINLNNELRSLVRHAADSRTLFLSAHADRQSVDISVVVCVFVCWFVRLRICSARIELTASNFARWFMGVWVGILLFLGNFAPQKPKIG